MKKTGANEKSVQLFLDSSVPFFDFFFLLLCLLQTRCFVNLTAVEPGPSSPQNYTNTQQ